MPDIGEKYTDAALEGLRRRLREVYSDAQRDVAMKLSSFEHAHRERVKKHLAEVREGKITQEDFKAWMRGQVFQREQWQKKQQCSKTIQHAADKRRVFFVVFLNILFGKCDNFLTANQIINCNMKVFRSHF